MYRLLKKAVKKLLINRYIKMCPGFSGGGLGLT